MAVRCFQAIEATYFPEATASSSNFVCLLPASGAIRIEGIPFKIKIKDDIPKRLGGKELTMKQINKLRYG